jgi:hypothetical protein
MDIEREALAEAGVGAAATVFFIAVVYTISQAYATNGSLQPTGGLAIVATIGLFILVLGLGGLWLSMQEF